MGAERKLSIDANPDKLLPVYLEHLDESVLKRIKYDQRTDIITNEGIRILDHTIFERWLYLKGTPYEAKARILLERMRDSIAGNRQEAANNS
ncbi:MAG: hypothetical protein G01um10145_928 [Microgenomates group bacterium Gr01-1014_5]|nr:MAG: hypothetical protein G01um10145_928 [Microgenomates group bacterium Gr01-1014_5]